MKVKAACEVHGVCPKEVVGGKASFTKDQGRPQGSISIRKELQDETEI